MTRIYFCRHGEATGNVNFTFQGSCDNPLTDNGREQCRLLAERMKDIHLDAIYTSPLSRAWETARIINQYHNARIYIDNAFQEVCCGAMENYDMLDLHKDFPEAMYLWDHEPWNFKAPMGDDSTAKHFDAMLVALRRLVRNHPDQTLLISSHGGELRLFNTIAQGLDITHIGEMGWGDNTCLSCAEFEDEDLNGRLVMKNDVSHVDKSMITPDFWLIKDKLKAERDSRRAAEGGSK